MVRVLVVGASGYIGFNVATALRANGHRVWGTVRKEKDANNLAQKEVTPIIGDFSDSKTISNDVLDQVSVVIDTVLNFGDPTPMATNRALLKAVSDASNRAVAVGSSKKRYIYVSGVLVYGDQKGQVVDESTLIKGGGRVTFEKEVTAAKDVEGVVIRPGWVYGGADGRYTPTFWKGNAKDEIEVAGNPNKYWGWIHISDLADAFVRATEASTGDVSGQVFDVTDSTRLTLEQIRVLLSRKNGVKGPVVHLPAGNDYFSQLCESSALPASEKIKRVLGWRPHFGPLQDEVDLWYLATKATGAL